MKRAIIFGILILLAFWVASEIYKIVAEYYYWHWGKLEMKRYE